MEAKIKLLESKKSAMFARLNRLYESSKTIVTAETRSCENFLASTETVDQLRTEYMSLIDEVNELSLKSDATFIPNFEAISAFDELYSYVKRVRAKYDTLNKSSTSTATCAQPAKCSTKLPPIVLPSFDGKIENWPVFYESFKANIHNNVQLSDSQRIQYLMGKLTHNALKLTAGVIPNGDNYASIWEGLVKRYQDTRALGTYYLNSILELKSYNYNSHNLNKFIENFSSAVQALEQLKIEDLKDFIFLSLALKRVDSQTAQLFEMSVRDKEIPSYKDFVTFAKGQVKILERTTNTRIAFNNNIPSPSVSAQSRVEPFVKRNTHSFVINSNMNFHCKLCKKNDHQRLYECTTFKDMPVTNRFDYIKINKGCVNCLSLMHSVYNCKSKHVCRNCNKRHHSLLHFNKAPIGTSNAQSTNVINAHAQCKAPAASPDESSNAVSLCTRTKTTPLLRSTVLLSTAQIHAKNKQGKNVLIRCLIDNASQDNIITIDCCRKLNLDIISLNNSFIKGVGNTSRPIRGYVMLNIESRISGDKFNIQSLVVDSITDKLPTVFIDPSVLQGLSRLPLADSTWNIPGDVDLVLGAKLFPHILLAGRSPASATAPPAIETIFGYVLMGNVPTSLEMESESRAFCSISNTALDNTLNKFWELEEFQNNKFISPDESQCEKLYEDSVTRDKTGRYRVDLPFCREPELLGNSYTTAYNRFTSLERKLDRNPPLRNKYNEIIKQYCADGYLSEIPPGNDNREGYYIPHHPVIREDKTTTKIRLVLDASCKTDSTLSLNDILYAGCNLQNDLFTILLNFRLFKFALTADIKQMYLQITINPNHRIYQKILFRFNTDEKIRTFSFNCVAFGIKSSPFLALRTVRQLISDEREKFPQAASVAESQIYMDDLATSVINENEAVMLASDLISLFKLGGFELTKWASNSNLALSEIPESLRLLQHTEFDKENSLKVLGLKWNQTDDTLTYEINNANNNVCTKRTILSTVARLWDVLGLAAPVILYAKLLIKELWLQQIGWDETPPNEIVQMYKLFTKELPLLTELRIPRHLNVVNNCRVNLVAFADASLKAYGCVIYFHVTNPADEVSTNIVCAKSKVAPVKIVSLARLELCANLLMAKLVRLVYNTYNSRYHINDIFAFSDSKIALSWIHSSPHRWNIFVSNRVAQCQDILNSKHFYHVAGIDNPSDCLSRGLRPSQLKSHNQWWCGPPWLRDPISLWPIEPFTPATCSELPEFNSKTLIVTATRVSEPSLLCTLALRVSSWLKLLRIVVYVFKFIRKIPRSNMIIASDLNMAETMIISQLQNVHFKDDIINIKQKLITSNQIRKLDPFVDDAGILRVGGRLSNADLPYEARHPAILPKRDHIVNIIIDFYHKTQGHAGPDLLIAIIRQRFWILSARNIVRHRVRLCNRCFKHSPSHPQPKMADLPSFRVRESKAFVNTGVDYAGPINITLSRRRGQRSQKAYICLFICLVTKAVHIELVSDLSTEAFLNAFKRFISRRGPVSQLYSDNGTNFVGAKTQLNEFLASQQYNTALGENLANRRIEWKMIPPRAPHFGGLWESNIKSFKTHLYRIIGSQLLTFEELMTILTQIEALLNSRPLCLLTADPHPEVLTPAHFLVSTPIQYLPAHEISQENTNLVSRKQLLDSLVQSYWQRWRQEYLHTLQIRQKWCKPDNPVTIGTVVLINQDNVPPLRWPLGVIEQVYPGKDGTVRVALIRTPTTKFKRPVVKLCPLPLQ